MEVLTLSEERPVDFYGGPFSNFAPSRIVLEDPFRPGVSRVYDTVEHRYQAMKATSQSAHDWIATAEEPGEAKARGRRTDLRPDWEDAKVAVMLEALREKYKDPFYQGHLLATGGRLIREDSPTDFVWGYRNGGENLLGLCLMQVRAELRGEEPLR